MRRRDFLGVLGGIAAASPVASRAQNTALPVIGFLNSEAPGTYAPRVDAFRRGLGEVGFVEGGNVAIEYRWAESQYERIPTLMSDLTDRQVAVLVVNGPAAYASKTARMPVVFFTGDDPVALGLVASLNHPGGNVTGVTVLNIELTGKRLEILREAVPTAQSFGLLVNPDNGNAKILAEQTRSSARTLGLQVHVREATDDAGLKAGFDSLKALGVGGLVVGADGFFTSHSRQLAALATRYELPTIFVYRDFVAEGGLLSYGASIADAYKQMGVYAGRILKGERAGDLPVVQSTRVELLVNLRTAKALGLALPTALLARADEVIE
jgi:putative ABC transport system substrate-binding protein